MNRAQGNSSYFSKNSHLSISFLEEADMGKDFVNNLCAQVLNT